LEKNHRGAHLWLFLAEAVAGPGTRAFGHGLLAFHRFEDVELFPKQDELAGGLHVLDSQGREQLDGFVLLPIE
jgi:hypothetical protein